MMGELTSTLDYIDTRSKVAIAAPQKNRDRPSAKVVVSVLLQA
jgi:hypothetical protein